MSSRIRYTKTANANILKSMRNFIVDETHYAVLLDTSNNSFEVLLANTGATVARGGPFKSLAYAKAGVKKSLKELGVSFSAETRTRTKNESEEVSLSA